MVAMWAQRGRVGVVGAERGQGADGGLLGAPHSRNRSKS
jgi:hypothetical protein